MSRLIIKINKYSNNSFHKPVTVKHVLFKVLPQYIKHYNTRRGRYIKNKKGGVVSFTHQNIMEQSKG
jgi:hypothetical protein